MPEYPEHEKLAKIAHRSQAVYDFLEWAGSQGYQLMSFHEGTAPDMCRYCGHTAHVGQLRVRVKHVIREVGLVPPELTGDNASRYVMEPCTRCSGTGLDPEDEHDESGWVPGPIDRLLHDHYDIDALKISDEKEQMLAHIREAQKHG